MLICIPSENYYCKVFSLEFSDHSEEIGIKEVGKLINKKRKVSSEEKEIEVNCNIFFDLANYFQSSMDAFIIIQKNSLRKPLTSNIFLKIVNSSAKARQLINSFIEYYKVCENNVISPNLPYGIEMSPNSSTLKLPNINQGYNEENTLKVSSSTPNLGKPASNSFDDLNNFIQKSLKRLFPYMLIKKSANNINYVYKLI